MLFRNATTAHLGIARLLVFGVLIVDLVVDSPRTLACMPPDAFLPHGVLKLIPPDRWGVIFTTSFLQAFTIVYGGALLMGALGLGIPWVTTGISIALTTFFHGIARGFGGHVNHQELIVLHVLFFFMFKPSYDSYKMSFKSRHGSRAANADEIARFLLRSATFWVLLTYFYIGVARLQTSDWRVYGTNAMVFYASLHSIKWNYWEFNLARNVLEQPWLAQALTWSFPFATILELAAPFAVFFRILVWPVVLSLVTFHLAILLFMNIFFWQNLLLLLLPLFGWWIDRKWMPSTKTGAPLIVFFDGECGLCNRFVQKVAQADTADCLRFAPLEGDTARKMGITAPSDRSEWSIVVSSGNEMAYRSNAVLEILRLTPRWADFADFASLVPVSIRDAIYGVVARNRYRLFSKTLCPASASRMLEKLLP